MSVLVGGHFLFLKLSLGCRRSYYLGLLRVPLRSLDSSLEGLTPLLNLVNGCLAGLNGGGLSDLSSELGFLGDALCDTPPPGLFPYLYNKNISQ